MTVQPLPQEPPIATEPTPRDSTLSPAADPVSTHLRTKFLRRVAHDIASPSGVAVTALEELANDTTRPELVAMARRGLKRLLRLSEQLAVVADLEGGPVDVEVAPEDLRALVRAALEQATLVDGRRDIKASCDASPDGKTTAKVDRRLVVSSLREIIGNALRLASSQVVVRLEESAERAIIRVEDDGPGFSADALKHLGQRFHEGSCARGLGLSLSIAHEVLAAHGGDLRVEASTLPPGRRGVAGAAVVVTLPLVR